MNEVKRYAIISDDWDYVESPSGGFVDHDDYAALEAECKILRNSLAGSNNQARANKLEAEKFAIDWLKVLEERDDLAAERDLLKACQENAQLHITGLVAERNAALMQRDKLAEALRDVESAYTTAIHWEDMPTAMAQIKTALSEPTP